MALPGGSPHGDGMKRSAPTAVLAVNAGSSSVKLAIFHDGNPPVRASSHVVPTGGSLQAAAKASVAWVAGEISRASIAAIGHRVVFSGRRPLVEPVERELLDMLRGASVHQPEHLPLQVALIDQFRKWAPDVPAFACSDSAFHATMPRVARLLAIPFRLQSAGFERYGFHGLSCAYLMEELERLGGAGAANGRVIIAHLGNGASVTAVRHGQSIDTSMGYTPAGGMPMSTRAGDLDAGAVESICAAEGLTPEGFNRMVNEESGLLGVAGTTGNIRDLLARSPGDARAADAVDLFCYQARKWIGAFTVVLGGLDTLIFAGGIGEHLAVIRERICSDLAFLGLRVDADRNANAAAVISADGSRVAVRVIPTDEEAMIARATSRARGRAGPPPTMESS